MLARQRFDQQPRLGPARLVANRSGPDQQAQPSTGFGRQLQPPPRGLVQPPRRAEHRPHAGRAQRLVERPAFVTSIAGMHHDQLLRLEARPRRGGRIKRPLAIDHHERTMFAAGFARGGQRQPQSPAARRRGQPLDQRAAPQAAFGQQPIELRAACRGAPPGMRPPRALATAEGLLQLSDDLAARGRHWRASLSKVLACRVLAYMYMRIVFLSREIWGGGERVIALLRRTTVVKWPLPVCGALWGTYSVPFR